MCDPVIPLRVETSDPYTPIWLCPYDEAVMIDEGFGLSHCSQCGWEYLYPCTSSNFKDWLIANGREWRVRRVGSDFDYGGMPEAM